MAYPDGSIFYDVNVLLDVIETSADSYMLPQVMVPFDANTKAARKSALDKLRERNAVFLNGEATNEETADGSWNIILEPAYEAVRDEYREYYQQDAVKNISTSKTNSGRLTTKTQLSYANSTLWVEGYEIKISGVERTLLCETVFRDEKSMRRVWPYDEILEQWSLIDAKYAGVSPSVQRKPYDAARRLNERVAVASQGNVQELILRTADGTGVRVNPQYIT